MPAFNLEHEYSRIAEMDAPREEKISSVRDSLRTYLMERTAAPSSFGLEIVGDDVLAPGYEHRGDLMNSYERSVEEAETDRIAKRYELENFGYEKAKGLFFQYPVYSTVVLMSPTPDKPIPGYPGHHMTYFYHILPHEGGDEKKRTIKALAWVNDLEKKEQAGLLSEFGGTTVIPTEDAILTNPVVVSTETEDTQSFQLLWGAIGRVVEQKVRSYPYPSPERMEQYLLHGKNVWENEYRELSEMVNVFAEKIVDSKTREDFMKTAEMKITVNLADKLLFKDVSASLKLPRAPIDTFTKDRTIFEAFDYLDFTPRTAFTSCGLDDFGGGFGTPGSVMTASYVVGMEGIVMRPEDDPSLCKCGGTAAHFHCPGTKVQKSIEYKKNEQRGKHMKDKKDPKNDKEKKVPCRFKIIVGRGTTRCPDCGESKKC